MVSGRDIREKYLKFFESKGHVVIPSAPLVPENDPTVLFTTAGMHPLVPYLLGQPHSAGKRLVDYQKCVRTDDIEEVGDNFHHTFFEMLGNWSLGDYFKKEAISWSYEFLTKELNIDPKRIFITCFEGDSDAPKDEESAGFWQDQGIPTERISFLGKKDNWWGPAGQTGPCGPDTEMHYDVTQKPCSPDCKPGDGCDRFCEIWNDVFMQYNKTSDGKFEKLAKPNVDTGMGLERTTAVLNGLDDNYLTDLWQPIIKTIEDVSGQNYESDKRSFRIISDHLRASVFLISDGVIPSNKERGYVLRRLIRRALVILAKLKNAKILDILNAGYCLKNIVNEIAKTYGEFYPKLKSLKENINQILEEEWIRFLDNMKSAYPQIIKLMDRKEKLISGEEAFHLFESHGILPSVLKEVAARYEKIVDWETFSILQKNHQNLSRTAGKGMFKGGLQDQSETTTRYHTATHLLHAALRKVLGNSVSQKGSNITAERLRFDFSFDRKLTEPEIKAVEDLVNQKIKEDLVVERLEMQKSKALEMGAMAFFPEKYPDLTSVYKIGDFSLELCGGPHVASTGAVGKFKIDKEESAGSGIRRVYATALFP